LYGEGSSSLVSDDLFLNWILFENEKQRDAAWSYSRQRLSELFTLLCDRLSNFLLHRLVTCRQLRRRGPWKPGPVVRI